MAKNNIAEIMTAERLRAEKLKKEEEQSRLHAERKSKESEDLIRTFLQNMEYGEKWCIKAGDICLTIVKHPKEDDHTSESVIITEQDKGGTSLSVKTLLENFVTERPKDRIAKLKTILESSEKEITLLKQN